MPLKTVAAAGFECPDEARPLKSDADFFRDDIEYHQNSIDSA
jgi:hypothetical protein